MPEPESGQPPSGRAESDRPDSDRSDRATPGGACSGGATHVPQGSPPEFSAQEPAPLKDPARTPGWADRVGKERRLGIGSGPGRLLILVYGVFTVAAASRSLYQLIAQYEDAPLAYVLSAVSALVYAFITLALVRGGEGARRAALLCCAAELVGVLVVGTWTLVEPAAFPDETVWSDYGMGYLFIPIFLPVTGLLWLRRASRA